MYLCTRNKEQLILYLIRESKLKDLNKLNIMANEKNYRIETDLLGELKVPAEALYGVQTQRGINNSLIPQHYNLTLFISS